ncbi:MAG: Na/Pi symporter, partial [Firmicutes bacterium]|nr:Na/Pi symporter [Bacillota bacterium]
MNGLQIALTLFGGLALFIYGMNLMSDGLQKAAGEKMKSILALLTKNPLIGVLAGALVTAVIQSSSATTVMVIGFVSAGLMNLPQAIMTAMTTLISLLNGLSRMLRMAGCKQKQKPAKKTKKFWRYYVAVV